MGINLNSQGELTFHQAEQAKLLGISEIEMKKQIVERLIDIHGGKTPETKRTEEMKRDTITAEKPVLILGAGPSTAKNMKYIMQFKHPIVCVDFAFNDLVEKGIVPDYVITLEETKHIINPDIYKSEYLEICKHKTKIVGSSITRPNIERHIKEHGVVFERYRPIEEPRYSNVGVMAVNYVHTVLHADKILLVGFEHVGQKYPQHIYQVWQTDFWYFIRQWPKEAIVNCSNGGALYYEDYIIDSKLDKLKIE